MNKYYYREISQLMNRRTFVVYKVDVVESNFLRILYVGILNKKTPFYSTIRQYNKRYDPLYMTEERFNKWDYLTPLDLSKSVYEL